MVDPIKNFAPTTPQQRAILEKELADTTAQFEAATDPEMRQQHAQNIIIIRRTLAGKGTDLPASEDMNPDRAAQMNAQTNAAPVDKNNSMDLSIMNTGPKAPSDASANTMDLSIMNPAPAPTPPPEAPGTGIYPRGGFVPNAALGRVSAETVGGTAGAILGARVAGPAGEIAGSGIGGAAGSLVSELWDPTAHPVVEAVNAGAAQALGAGVGVAGISTLRKLIGKPNEAGQWLLAAAEKEGRVPPPGAVLPDSTLIHLMESIAQADTFTGQKIKDALVRTNGAMTDEIRAMVTSYARTKMEADRAFKNWDNLLKTRIGDSSLVSVDDATYKALIPLIKGWEELGLLSKLDNGLVQKVKMAQQAMENGQNIPKLMSLSEAEAARTLFYRASMEAAKGAMNARKTVGGGDFARAYRDFGAEVGKQMDEAISYAVKRDWLPLDARAELQGARNLWTKWKQGEAVLDELTIPLQAAERRDGPLKADELFSALKRLDQTAEKIGHPVISKEQEQVLTGIARAMKQVETAAEGKSFTWVVRMGQLSLVTGGAFAGGPGGALAGTAVAMTPTLLNWILTNPKTASWIIRGMQVDAGTAAGTRLARQFLSAAMKEGLVPPSRDFAEQQANEQALQNTGGHRMIEGLTGKLLTPPPTAPTGIPGVSGTPVPNPNPAPRPFGSFIRG